MCFELPVRSPMMLASCMLSDDVGQYQERIRDGIYRQVHGVSLNLCVMKSLSDKIIV